MRTCAHAVGEAQRTALEIGARSRSRRGEVAISASRDAILASQDRDLGALEAEDERVLAAIEESEDVTLGHRVLQVLPRGGT